jgi:hypothetical protein
VTEEQKAKTTVDKEEEASLFRRNGTASPESQNISQQESPVRATGAKSRLY